MTTVSRALERVPRGLVVLVALVAVGVGVVLTLHPFASIEALVLLTGAGALLTGVLAVVAGEEGGERRTTSTVARRRVEGIAWIVLGIVVLAWPSITVRALAWVVGLGLVAQGIVRLVEAVTGRATRDRVAAALGGLASTAFGGLALAWPDATVFVVAVLFGAGTVRFGLAQIFHVLRHHRPTEATAAAVPSTDVPSTDVPSTDMATGGGLRRVGRLAGHTAALVVALVLVAASVTLRQGGSEISAFYDTPDDVPATPGALLRVEPFDRDVPEGAEAWLVLYSTETTGGDTAVATAVVMASTTPPPGPRPVVAWTHGTVGIDRPCAPSLAGNPFTGLPYEEALDRGWVLVATDYAGMGTEGVSPYLVGPGQAQSALDSVRATRQMDEVEVDDRTVVWGHSQGGHASLWTGMLASSYAPELTIDGVVALSPATDLSAMAAAAQGRPGGALASAFVITAYSGTYDDVRFDDYVRPGASVEVREAAKRCLSDPSLLVSIITSLPMSQSVTSADPTTGPLGERLAENLPDDPIDAPLLVAQGTSDEVIPFAITEGWVDDRCARGQHLELMPLPGRSHMSIFEEESGLPDRLISWTADRFDGVADTPTC